MDDDSSPFIRILRTAALWLLLGGLSWWAFYSFAPVDPSGDSVIAVPGAHAQGAEDSTPTPDDSWDTYLPVWLIVLSLMLLALSSFFSGSEAAFFSIHRVRLRAMGEESGGTARKVARLMDNPGRLLTTILVGNTIVNVLIGLLLGTRVESAIHATWRELPDTLAYLGAIVGVTAALVLVGEITPKVLAVRTSERFARTVAWPLALIDQVIKPVRDGLLRFTDFLFRVTRFAELRAAPFITDEEFKSVFTNETAGEAIEEDERQMIRGILEFTDAQLREILVPRPDVVALSRDNTVADALNSFRKNAFSRMPVYGENLDQICGVVVMKDLLPHITQSNTDIRLGELVRPAFFAPETMTIRQFVREARQRRAHIAVVVDEYGGTEGIATLHDALEEVVGDIHEENEQDTLPYRELGNDTFRVEGNLPLDELSDLLGIPFEDSEHETVAGYLMGHSDKVLEVEDTFEVNGAEFVIEACKGKRVSSMRVRVLSRPGEEGA